MLFLALVAITTMSSALAVSRGSNHIYWAYIPHPLLNCRIKSWDLSISVCQWFHLASWAFWWQGIYQCHLQNIQLFISKLVFDYPLCCWWGLHIGMNQWTLCSAWIVLCIHVYQKTILQISPWNLYACSGFMWDCSYLWDWNGNGKSQHLHSFFFF